MNHWLKIILIVNVVAYSIAGLIKWIKKGDSAKTEASDKLELFAKIIMIPAGIIFLLAEIIG